MTAATTSFEEFSALLSGRRVVPVVRELFADLIEEEIMELAGTRFRGQFEERLNGQYEKLIDEHQHWFPIAYSDVVPDKHSNQH